VIEDRNEAKNKTYERDGWKKCTFNGSKYDRKWPGVVSNYKTTTFGIIGVTSLKTKLFFAFVWIICIFKYLPESEGNVLKNYEFNNLYPHL